MNRHSKRRYVGQHSHLNRTSFEELESRQLLCGSPFTASGTIGDGVPDFYYAPQTGALIANADGNALESIVVDGPVPNSVQFQPPNWSYMYFNNSMQWFYAPGTQGATGAFRLATLNTGLNPPSAMPCVDITYDNDANPGNPSVLYYTNVASDASPPVGVATAGNITGTSNLRHRIVVNYSDNAGLDVSTIGNGDVRVTGPGGYSQLAQLISASLSANGRAIQATYDIPTNGAAWDAADAGVYTILTQPSQVEDLADLAMAGGVAIGTFNVSINLTISSFSVPITLNEGSVGTFVAFATGVGTSRTYHWDFGDGDTAVGQIVNHAYADNGLYSVLLTVTDNLGNIAYRAGTVNVSNVPPNANDDQASLTVASGSVITNLLSNDTDAGTDDLLAISSINGQQSPLETLFGTLSWMPSGQVTYSVDPANPAIQALPLGSMLQETFVYAVDDGDGGVDTAFLKILIQGSAPLPTPVSLLVDSGNTLGNGPTTEVDLADLDGDGDLDAFATNGSGIGETVWLNNGLGVLTDSGQRLGTSIGIYAALGDIDGDGDQDAVVAALSQVRFWRNNGAGVFSPGQELSTNGAYDVALGDLNADGDLDLYVASATSNDQVWVNDGTGLFVNSGQALEAGASKGIELGDLDGDGDLDAFVAVAPGTGGAPNTVWFNNGGILTDSGQRLGNGQTQHVTLGDLDGDGDLDAFFANSKNFNEPDEVWLNVGGGQFVDSGQRLGNFAGSHVQLADFDLDGDLDVYQANYFGPDRIWINLGGAVFADSQQLIGSDSEDHVAVGDIDGDGDRDVIWANSSGANRIWLNRTINRPPILLPDTLSGNEDTTTAISPSSLLANDSDPEGDALSVVGMDQTSALGASISYVPGMSGTYDPRNSQNIQSLPQGVTAPDTFSYSVSDGEGNVVSGTVTVNVLGVNDQPIVQGDSIAMLCTSGIQNLTTVMLSNDSDIDLGTTLTIIGLDSTGTLGQVSLTDGQVAYNPASACGGLPAGQTVIDTFSYQVTDGIVVVQGTVTVSVTAPFDPLDFDFDGDVDGDDIDLISICENLSCQESRFDLDGNGSVNSSDVLLMLNLMGILPGDANLDGNVDGTDFGIWNSNKFTARDPAQPGVGWVTGDFNTDGVTDGSDFGIWNAFKFRSFAREDSKGSSGNDLTPPIELRSVEIRADSGTPIGTISTSLAGNAVSNELFKKLRSPASKTLRLIDLAFEVGSRTEKRAGKLNERWKNVDDAIDAAFRD
jgi:VCBS repeat-containing protein